MRFYPFLENVCDSEREKEWGDERRWRQKVTTKRAVKHYQNEIRHFRNAILKSIRN
jgi:hypothetical protein